MEQLWQGTLRKMQVAHDSPVRYALVDGHHDPGARAAPLPLNPLLGQRVTLRFLGAIHCVYCGRQTRQSFGEGFCYPCFQARAEADVCIVKPELCHHGRAADPCRDEAFAQAHCFQPHLLYVALTSGVKVGITRQANVPTRWIDQGAVEAVALARLPSRRAVGEVEHSLAEHVADRTHWMRLLKQERPDEELAPGVATVLGLLDDWGIEGVLPATEQVVQHFAYPVLQYPAKVKSHNLDKQPELAGTLIGIKGQYLLLDSVVINLRKYTGYQVAFASA